MKTYDIFLFDADDTLYDFNKAEKQAIQATFEAFGIAYSDDYLPRYRAHNLQLWADYSLGAVTKADLQTLRFERLFAELSVGTSCDIPALNARYQLEIGKAAFLVDGALEICRAIASDGKHIYIATNGTLATQESRAVHSPLRHYVSGFFVSEEIGFQKPEPGYFDCVFSCLPSIHKEKILIIGDSLTHDVAGGHTAGIDSCWLNTHGKKNDTEFVPTYEIRRLSELAAFVTMQTE